MMGPKVHYTEDGVTAVCGAAQTMPIPTSRKLSPEVEYRSPRLDDVNCGACDAVRPIPPPTPPTFKT